MTTMDVDSSVMDRGAAEEEREREREGVAVVNTSFMIGVVRVVGR
jgi:hypothetical protein